MFGGSILAAAVATGAMSFGNVEIKCGNPGGWEFKTSVSRTDAKGGAIETLDLSLVSKTNAVPPKFTVEWKMPQVGIHNVWWVNHPECSVRPDWWKSVNWSTLAGNSPIYAFLDARDRSTLGMFVSECERKVFFRTGVREEGSTMETSFSFFEEPDVPMRKYDVSFRFDSRRLALSDIVPDGVRFIEEKAGYKIPPAPEAAFDPVYSSWYNFHQNVSADAIEAELAIAAKLGMKTFLLDDGWQTDDSSRGYAYCGDWQVSTNRFPDFAAHVKRVQDMGFKYMVWYSVPFVGFKSANYPRFKDKFLYADEGLKAGVLDPRFPEVREFLIGTYVKALKDWNLDGFKLDFIDSFWFREGDPAEKNGFAGRDIRGLPAAVDALMSGVRAALEKVKPGVLIEFRQSYNGPAIRKYGNMLRVSDCPGDMRQNRTQIAAMRMSSGASAVHSDMLEWNFAAPADEAALHIVNSMFGAVQYSVMLRDAPKEHLDMIAKWIRFSQDHREALLHGSFRAYHPELGYPMIVGESADERVVGLYASNQIVDVPDSKRTFIMNASADNLVKVIHKGQLRWLWCRPGNFVEVDPPAPEHAPLMTEWGEKVTPENAWREYPRPQMVRGNWTNLNGLWDYAVTSVTNTPGRPDKWDGKILVPFAIESALSGVGRRLAPDEFLWYTREIECDPKPGERILLHFGGVDYRTMVFIGHNEVTDVPHEGGQNPFTLDITPYVRKGANTLTVCVWDPTEDYVNSRGKQSFTPSGCFYTRVSGIWQTVWMETVPELHIKSYKVYTDIDTGTVRFAFDKVEGAGDVSVTTDMPRDFECWSPENPRLYNFTARYGRDEIKGYFGMRKIEKRKDGKGFLRFYLNNKPYFLLGTLDQGWWPDGLLTPPSEEAMAHDIKTLKDCGFNMMRKHIKVEPMRYYALCDRMGILLIQDLPSGTGNWADPMKPATAGRYWLQRQEMKEMMDNLQAVPSIVMWNPYNEGWSQPGEFLTHSMLDFTRRYDPTRLVNGPSGCWDWEGGELLPNGWSVRDTLTKHKPEGECEAADTVDMHCYRGPAMFPANGRRISFLGEFGGLGHPVAGHLWKESKDGSGSWGYGGIEDTKTREGLEKTYLGLMDKVIEMKDKGLAGTVYTQTTDVEIEINGVMTYDRKVLKFNPAVLKAVHERIFNH